jgi:hypothetical protein
MTKGDVNTQGGDLWRRPSIIPQQGPSSFESDSHVGSGCVSGGDGTRIAVFTLPFDF